MVEKQLKNKSSHNILKFNSMLSYVLLLCCVYLLLICGGCSDKWENMGFCECETTDTGDHVHLKSRDWCRFDIVHDQFRIVAYEFMEHGVVDYDLIREKGRTKLALRPKVNKGKTLFIGQADRKEIVGYYPAAKFVTVDSKYVKCWIDVDVPLTNNEGGKK